MTNKKNIIILYIMIFLEIIILINSKTVIKSVINSMMLFSTSIFPSLFPTSIIGNLIIKLNINKIIPKFIKILFKKLFNFNEISTTIFILSIICGSPTSSMIINSYYKKGLINESNAINMLYITQFMNPLFIIGFVGNNILKSTKLGLLLFIILILSNFIKAYLIRNKFNYQEINITNNNINIKEELINTIKYCVNSMLLIFGIIILFNILISLLKEIFNLNIILTLIINSLLEVTSGISLLAYINIPIVYKFIISYLILNFGGLCIHMQTTSLIETKKISYKKYLIFRGI